MHKTSTSWQWVLLGLISSSCLSQCGKSASESSPSWAFDRVYVILERYNDVAPPNTKLTWDLIIDDEIGVANAQLTLVDETRHLDAKQTIHFEGSNVAQIRENFGKIITLGRDGYERTARQASAKTRYVLGVSWWKKGLKNSVSIRGDSDSNLEFTKRCIDILNKMVPPERQFANWEWLKR